MKRRDSVILTDLLTTADQSNGGDMHDTIGNGVRWRADEWPAWFSTARNQKKTETV